MLIFPQVSWAATNYYTFMDLSRNASQAEIKKAYRKLAIQYHPDKNPGDKIAEEKSKSLNEAYEVLSNPEKRAFYDRYGRAPRPGEKAPPQSRPWHKWSPGETNNGDSWRAESSNTNTGFHSGGAQAETTSYFSELLRSTKDPIQKRFIAELISEGIDEVARYSRIIPLVRDSASFYVGRLAIQRRNPELLQEWLNRQNPHSASAVNTAITSGGIGNTANFDAKLDAAIKVQTAEDLRLFLQLDYKEMVSPEVWKLAFLKPNKTRWLVFDLKVTDPKFLEYAIPSEDQKLIETLEYLEQAGLRNLSPYLGSLGQDSIDATHEFLVRETRNFPKSFNDNQIVKELLQRARNNKLTEKQTAEMLVRKGGASFAGFRKLPNSLHEVYLETLEKALRNEGVLTKPWLRCLKARFMR